MQLFSATIRMTEKLFDIVVLTTWLKQQVKKGVMSEIEKNI